MLVTIAILSCLLIGIAAVASAFLTSRSQNHEQARRLDLVALIPAISARTGKPDASRVKDKAGSILPRIFALGMKQRWPLPQKGQSLVVWAVAPMLGTWIVGYLISGHLSWIGLAVGVAAFFLMPHWRLRKEQARIDREFVELFPDAIDMIVRMLRAGLPITATIRTVGQEATPPVNLIFSELADQMDIGLPFEDALRIAAERIGLEDFRYFSVAASLQRATGGNLAETLEILSDIIRRKRAGRHKAKAVTAEVRMTAIVLGCLPIFIVGALMIIRPDYLSPLITDPRGNVIAAIAAGLLLFAFLIIQRMMRSVTRSE